MPAHRSGGLHRLLEKPALYRGLQRLLGAKKARRVLLTEYVRCGPTDRVLDMGCGPADLLALLPPGVRYTGFDLNPTYVEAARSRYGERGRFLVGKAGALEDEALDGPFDRILVVALIHHLADDEAAALVRQAARLLAPGGVLVTFDNVRLDDESPVARWLMRRDRGARVRSPDEYFELLRGGFARVDGDIRRDLLRVPYAHFISRSAASDEALNR